MAAVVKIHTNICPRQINVQVPKMCIVPYMVMVICAAAGAGERGQGQGR
jgi:hypothetical protein